MASKLFVDEIESSAASGISIVGEIKLNTGKAINNAAGTALLTEAGALDNVTLGSSAVFPATHPDITVVKPNWGGDETGTTQSVAGAYYNWQNKRASSTVYVEVNCSWTVWSDGDNKAQRGMFIYLYYNTVAVLDDATTGFGTNMATHFVGRKLAGDSTSTLPSYGTATITGKFTSGGVGTDYYIGISQRVEESSVRHKIYGGTNSGETANPLLKIFEV